ncbi:SUKH-4 family immunity protein [Streptomyces pseudovenezuelae]|uniref:SUKH-4 immunity protein n=1 Tax=Streptomyces pseudovenezuelae TaxID=67350 RepID=A0ABT6LF27_9ACTN|nr:SUKH-4 family immunity protein [Streptomyces pseudovenezuelae]MDH6214913.1 hypothetical protein [Streptomyces pseudovenezuelae]
MDVSLVTVTGDNGVSLEIPDNFFEFSANERLEPVVSEDGEKYYQIWHLGHHLGVYLHWKSGTVVAGSRLDRRVFANSTIQKFRECVLSLAEHFPYYSDDPDQDELNEAGRNLENLVGAIDRPAVDEGTFWSDFISDIVMGSYVE